MICLLLNMKIRINWSTDILEITVLRGPGGGGGGLHHDFLEIDFLVVSDREE